MAAVDPAELIAEEGLALERQGDRAGARGAFERALRSLDGSESDLPAKLTRWIGRTYMNEGNLESAIEYGALSLSIAQAHGDLVGAAHAANLLGSSHLLRGDLEEAMALLQECRANALQAGDPELVPMVDQNLGIIANIQGNLSRALEHYHSSLKGFRAAGMEDHVGYVLNNLGMLHTDRREWEEAAIKLDEAEASAERSGNALTRVMVEVNRAEMWIERRDLVRARNACDRAKAWSQEHEITRAEGELLKHYGVIAREQMDYAGAEGCLTRAAGIAEGRQDLLLGAEVAREQARLAWRQQRHQETLRHLNRAHTLFTQLHARRELADITGRLHELEGMFVDIVSRWSDSIESADRYTQGHCERVADYACTLARAVGLDERDLFWFRLGALLHDVGKIVVPPEILNKGGAFTDEERVIMEKHPDAGVALLAGVEFPWDIRPMVRFHHERWDGGGYPTGIAGEEIPLSARILCIADVYDALSSDRPYRPAHSPAESIRIMTTHMRDHFDPELLDRWLEIAPNLGASRRPFPTVPS